MKRASLAEVEALVGWTIRAIDYPIKKNRALEVRAKVRAFFFLLEKEKSKYMDIPYNFFNNEYLLDFRNLKGDKVFLGII